MFISNISNIILRRPHLCAELFGHTGAVISLSFSRTGRLLASGGTSLLLFCGLPFLIRTGG